VTAGYSGKPLAAKLGITPGTRVVVLGEPWPYRKTVQLPSDVEIGSRLARSESFIHLFATARGQLERQVPRLTKVLRDDGILWVSWPKKSSGVASDVTEDAIRAVALPLDLVDVKVCAVDEVWSGLKLVKRLTARGQGRPPR
jgi:hypothetical protein